MATTRGQTDEAEDGPAQMEAIIREIVAGDKRGAVRRIVLYVAAFALCVSPVPLAAVLPLTLLVATDVLL